MLIQSKEMNFSFHGYYLLFIIINYLFIYLFQPSAKFMDPVCTFLFSVIVICSTLKLLKDSLYVVMEACPNNINYNNVLKNLKGLNGVRYVHNLCVWSLTINTNILTVHLIIGKTT